ncbi:MAG: cell division protein FtsQ/DivIB [Ottowia sp.]|nr:cell division protein FtsQ/DivIB [Ottowia sp.]
MTTGMTLPFDVRLMNFTAMLLVSLVVLAGAAAGAWWLARSPAFAIQQITVTGDTRHNTEVSLYSAVAGRLRGNFFTLNLASAETAFQNVPWVRTAVVQRRFPNQLRVHLQEHVPVARWGGSDTELVDRYGDVFATGDADAGQQRRLPLLLGPDGQGALLWQTYERLNAATDGLKTAIVRLELQPRGHWHAQLAQGAQIELGQGSAGELTRRMARFADTALQVAARYRRDAADIESADLRYERGYALRLRGVTTVAAE